MAELRRLSQVLLTFVCCILSCHATESGLLRLKGMHNGEGIVEIRHGRHWGLICASQWTMTAGDVACRQLGYEGATRVMRVSPGAENQNLNMHVLFNGTDCRGNESRLLECTHSGFGNFTEQCHPLKLPWVSCIGAESSVVGTADEVEEERSNSLPMSGRVLSSSTIAPVKISPSIEIQQVGSDRVTLSWLQWYDHLRTTDPTTYRIRIVIKYRRVDALGVEGRTNYTIAAETPTYWTHYTVTGLQEQVSYEFVVESVKLSMTGGEVPEPPSSPVFVTTVCSGPQPVRQLRVDSLPDNVTSLYLSWNIPIDAGCTTEEYVIEYQLMNREQCNTQDDSRTVQSGLTTNTEYILTELHPFSTYNVIVTARNSFGRSKAVNVTKRTGESVPKDPPVNIRHIVQTDSHLKLTWDPPTCGGRGGNVRSYSYMLIDIATDVVSHRGDTGREFVILSGVDVLRRHKFLVAAKTDAGLGPYAVADIPITPDILHICGTAWDPYEHLRSGPTARISSGLKSTRGSAPWLAQLWNADQGVMFCAGSILNEYWILTAAHCIQAQEMTKNRLKIQLGDFDTHLPETHQRVFDVEEIVVHQEFGTLFFDNDIALIKVAERIEFNDYIKPICLPTTKLAKAMLKNDRYGMVAGWGRQGFGIEYTYPRFLKQVMVPVVERKVCRKSTTYEFTSNMFCAGYSQANAGDACEGDSGAPFAVQHTNGRWYILGTVSWGDGCDMEDKYGFYTRVHRYTSWIKQHSRVPVS